MKSRTNPYGCTGACRRCMRSLATQRCHARGQSETQLCVKCADAWWLAVDAKLAERGVRPV